MISAPFGASQRRVQVPLGITPLLAYRPGNSGSSLTRATVARYRDTNGVLQQAASGALRDGHYVLNPATGLYERTTLVEEQRTNRITDSRNINGMTTDGTGLTVTTGQSDAFGGTGATLLSDTSTTQQPRKRATVTLPADGAYVLSVLVKKPASVAASGSQIRIFDITASATRVGYTLTWSGNAPVLSVVTGTHLGSTELTDGWWRIQIAGTGFVAANANHLHLIPVITTAQTGDLLIDQIQVEAGAFGTSPVITTGSAVTRDADQWSHTVAHAGQAVTRYLRYYDLSTRTWADSATPLTAASPYSPPVNRTYTHVDEYPGTLSLEHCRYVAGAPPV